MRARPRSGGRAPRPYGTVESEDLLTVPQALPEPQWKVGELVRVVPALGGSWTGRVEGYAGEPPGLVLAVVRVLGCGPLGEAQGVYHVAPRFLRRM